MSKLLNELDRDSKEVSETLLRDSLIQNVAHVFSELSALNSHPVNPFSLYASYLSQVPSAELFEENDAGEFFHILLERISLEASQNHLPSVSSIFESSLVVDYECGFCRETSSFVEFHLEIPRQKIYTEYFVNKNTGDGVWRIVPPDVEDCIDFSLRKDAQNGKCKCANESFPNRVKFGSLPNTLVINVNRVAFNGGKSSKDSGHIQISPNIDMTPFVHPEYPGALFSLTAVVVHHGKYAGTGHYSVYSKRDTGWCHFNDTEFTDISLKSTTEVCELFASSHPAILFYQRETETQAGYVELYQRLRPGNTL